MLLYVIRADRANRTYVGITRDFKRRLRQHNGELKGGARATRGHSWAPVVLVTGFREDRDARQLEWRLHQRKGRSRRRDRILARIEDLARALSMERWTKTAPAMKTLRKQLVLHWQDPAQRQCVEWSCDVQHATMKERK